MDRSIQLIAALCGIGVDAYLEIAGADGEGAIGMMDFARELGIADRVSYLGRITEEEKVAILQSRDAYLQLSRYEGFGIAAAEALLAGMTVVHSGEGGLASVIGNDGLMIDWAHAQLDDAGWVAGFYESFLEFEIDESTIEQKRKAFSLEARAIALGVGARNQRQRDVGDSAVTWPGLFT